ncbi:putative CMP/dCMP deaminase family protein [Octadecabacter antarcticus 307]|uniref:Putative CMP/dCMP deaminase family protein n=1 Tax=Octadecabacter antarcticus 307 TaxID=391626 RepID=M9RJV3_9RHOB|nr:anti-phage dCTP deaminase [Octadecabacter antarcticus]AGI70115.1 putative CMP/dCMP deaminase family protein [Octadecabacter antarcticus 307]
MSKVVDKTLATRASNYRPELVIGLVGPIGCDITTVQTVLDGELRKVGYSTKQIGLSDSLGGLIEAKTGKSEDINLIEEKMEAGNRVCQLLSNEAVLAAEAIRLIREARREEHESRGTKIEGGADSESLPAEGTAYIVRQLKREKEIDLLAKVYGRQFIQVSITQDVAARKQSLITLIGNQHPAFNNEMCSEQADDLIKKDEDDEDTFGQKIGDIFHLGDVFIEARSRKTVEDTCHRFIQALFGRNDISPTRDEFGAYMAKMASLRSVDLSRQVGAAILTPEADVISIGCNEVPKPNGGNYWDDDTEKHRDIDEKGEANKAETNRIVFDFLKALHQTGSLKDDLDPSGILDNSDKRKAIMASAIGDITEYGRMVHAEMNSISDAARLGRRIQGATMHVTTFPCHNCAKHIIAAGISRLVFIEPYPKSKTRQLYSYAISDTKDSDLGMTLEHFAGISPRRYRDIFEKKKRRKSDGTIEDWYQGKCILRIGQQPIEGTENEVHALSENMYSP